MPVRSIIAGCVGDLQRSIIRVFNACTAVNKIAKQT